MPSVLVGAPVPALAPFVSSVGYFAGRLPHARETVLPTGTVQLLVNLDADKLHSWDAADPIRAQRTAGAALQGPTTRPAMIDPADQRRVVWVCFRVGGVRPFFAADAAALADLLVDVDDLWPGGGGRRLRERLLDAPGPAAALAAVQQALLARARPPARDPAVVAAGRALHSGLAVAAVADRLGWTPALLRRRFAAEVGMTPKRFARVRRFQRLLRRASAAGADPDWARLAVECGYTDQAHLIHEFRSFAAMTPGGYAPRSADEPNHVPAAEISNPRRR